MTEQEIINVSTEDALLISGFIGREFPINVTWNDLMPVVEKINSLASNRIDTAVTISKHKVLIYYIGRHMSVRKPLIELKVDDSLITTIWQAVVDFIKWYNQQSK